MKSRIEDLYLSSRRRVMVIAALTCVAISALSAKPNIERVEPPYWWTGMRCDTLQLMVYGPGIANTSASIDYPGVTLIDAVRLDSPDYLLLYLNIGNETKPGKMKITLDEGRKSTKMEYALLPRDRAPEDYKGFDASDVLYLVMPDRFARGKDSPSDAERSKDFEYKVPVDRGDPNGRHGGDINGLREHLDYLDSLGVTAVWVNPVLKNDMPGGSYHGYATTDYYNIDPRLGSNAEWNAFVTEAHDKGIKVVMDMIFNHSGSNHPWVKESPSSDWFNFQDGYVQTNYRLSTIYDPYASDHDRRLATDGWFVESMPDLNQRNPHLAKYLTQNSIWWIEASKIDGIRMDTYPYADFNAMAQWIRDVKREYPNFNIVGECWYGNEGAEAYWQKSSIVNKDADPELPTVMDFVLSFKAREAFSSQTDAWNGINAIYDHLALDFLLPDPQHILTFLDNHDTDRFLLEVPEDLGWWKQAIVFLLTSRGIPQLYYGTELLMNGSKEGSDGYVRLDFPGGFDGDSTDAFTREGRSELQNQAWDFMSRVLKWRKGNKAISEGSLKHFVPSNGLYVYQRKTDEDEVIVMMNGNDTPITVSMANISEILPEGSTRHDVLTGEDVTITSEMMFPPRAILILEN